MLGVRESCQAFLIFLRCCKWLEQFQWRRWLTLVSKFFDESWPTSCGDEVRFLADPLREACMPLYQRVRYELRDCERLHTLQRLLYLRCKLDALLAQLLNSLVYSLYLVLHSVKDFHRVFGELGHLPQKCRHVGHGKVRGHILS